MGKPPKHRRSNAKGRTRSEGRYVLLEYDMVTTPAFRSLSGTALKYYIELRSRWNGLKGGASNNGKLHLSVDSAAPLLGMSKSTAHRAQKELVEKGFLKSIRDANFYQSRAAEFALTDRGWQDEYGTSLPGKDYRLWKPPEKQIIGTVTERKTTSTVPRRNVKNS